MSYRLVVVGTDDATSWWQTELLYDSLRKYHNANEANLTRVINLHNVNASTAYRYSCDIFTTKIYSDPHNKTDQSANRCLGFRDYMRQAKIEEDYILLLDMDTLITKSLFDIPSLEDGEVLTGYSRSMVEDAREKAKKLVYKHLVTNHHKANCGAANMYLAKTGTMITLSELYGNKTENILCDSHDRKGVGKYWDRWSMIFALIESGFRFKSKGRGKGLQWLASESIVAPVLHYQNLPDTRFDQSFDIEQYIPWKSTGINLQHCVAQGQRIFFDSLDEKASKEKFNEINIVARPVASVVANKTKKKTSILENAWLFRHIVTKNKDSTGWILMAGPVRNAKESAEFDRLREEGYRFIAVCCLKDWPRISHTEKIYEYNYSEIFEGWLHPFREPDAFLPNDGLPRDLLSRSDFISPALFGNYLGMPKERDFVAISSDIEWIASAKGWDLARRVIPVLCNDLGLKGTLIGRSDTKDLAKCSNLVIEDDRMPHRDFMNHLSSSRFYLCTSQEDASPRVVTESFCLNVPVLMNKNILGGWKYIKPETGEFFTNEYDIIDAYERLTKNERCPRDWYSQNSGPTLSGNRLAEFLKRIDPSFTEDFVALTMKANHQ